MPSSEAEELGFVRSSARRKEKLAVRALVNEYFREKQYIGHYDNGRPYLQNNVNEISISHCGRFAVILVHESNCVGVDVESLDRDFLKIESRLLSADERDDLPEKDRNLYLAYYWSAKEAVYKLMSQTSVDFASQIRIGRFSPKDEGSLSAVFIGKDGVETEIELEYMVMENHILVWCIDE